jgi:hypothetical protein
MQVGMACSRLYIALISGYTSPNFVKSATPSWMNTSPGKRRTICGRSLRKTLCLLSDFMFIAPEQHFLKNEVKHGGTAFQYVYYHNARPTFKPGTPEAQLGADLGDDVLFMLI